MSSFELPEIVKSETIQLVHITDLASIPIEHIDKFIRDLPELLTALRQVKLEGEVEGMTLQDLVPHVLFKPTSTD